jgi:transcriptional regulator CtsR
VIRVEIEENMLLDLVTRRIGAAISQKDAINIIDRLEELQTVSARESAIMRSAVCDEAFNIPLAVKDNVRAAVLKNMIISLLKEDDEP